MGFPPFTACCILMTGMLTMGAGQLDIIRFGSLKITLSRSFAKTLQHQAVVADFQKEVVATLSELLGAASISEHLSMFHWTTAIRNLEAQGQNIFTSVDLSKLPILSIGPAEDTEQKFCDPEDTFNEADKEFNTSENCSGMKKAYILYKNVMLANTPGLTFGLQRQGDDWIVVTPAHLSATRKDVMNLNMHALALPFSSFEIVLNDHVVVGDKPFEIRTEKFNVVMEDKMVLNEESGLNQKMLRKSGSRAGCDKRTELTEPPEISFEGLENLLPLSKIRLRIRITTKRRQSQPNAGRCHLLLGIITGNTESISWTFSSLPAAPVARTTPKRKRSRSRSRSLSRTSSSDYHTADDRKASNTGSNRVKRQRRHSPSEQSSSSSSSSDFYKEYIPMSDSDSE